MTTTIDFDALQVSEGPKVQLLGNQDVGGGLVGSDFADFSAFASLSVDVKVQRKSVRAPSPSLTVLVEHSDDGLSWSTAETFTFTDDGEQTASLASPKAHVRASASGSGAEWYVKSVEVAPVAGGGGGTPAGSDTQVQFNDGGSAFGASPKLVWTDADGLTVISTVRLANAANGVANLRCVGAGVQLFVSAADGDATHVGGEVNIKSGAGAGQNGGDFTIEAGSDSAAGTGGNISIKSGHSTAGDGGEVAIRANGATVVPGQGGQVVISGGSGTVGGGNVVVQGGSSNGNVQLYSGDSNQYVQLDNDGLQIGATKLGFFQGAAVAQPGVPVTLGDVIAALQALGLVAS